MVPGPMGNRSPADPVFDPFWARVNEARIPVTYHIGEPGFLKRHLIPEDKALWEFERFPDFLQAREDLIRRRLKALFLPARAGG